MFESWPAGAVLTGARLRLEPVSAAHAAEMAPLLDDGSLHTFIGGEPLAVDALAERYRRWESGRSPDGTEAWLNWVVRRSSDGTPVGTAQATVIEPRRSAEVAWVIATAHQGNGYGKEAAALMAEHLLAHGVRRLVAHVHPDHHASAAVAASLGLTRSGELVDGEEVWETAAG